MLFDSIKERKRKKIIDEVIAGAIKTGYGPPPVFFTPSEFQKFQEAIKTANEYNELFATIKYPKTLRPSISKENHNVEDGVLF